MLTHDAHTQAEEEVVPPTERHLDNISIMWILFTMFLFRIHLISECVSIKSIDILISESISEHKNPESEVSIFQDRSAHHYLTAVHVIMRCGAVTIVNQQRGPMLHLTLSLDEVLTLNLHSLCTVAVLL